MIHIALPASPTRRGVLMGYEYRLHLEPPISDLDGVCDEVFAETEWRRMPTCLVEISTAIGVGSISIAADPAWPNVADVCVEDIGAIYIVCHNSNGALFMNALVGSLRARHHRVVIDDDV